MARHCTTGTRRGPGRAREVLRLAARDVAFTEPYEAWRQEVEAVTVGEAAQRHRAKIEAIKARPSEFDLPREYGDREAE